MSSFDEAYEADTVYVVYTNLGRLTEVKVFTDLDEAKKYYKEQREVYAKVKAVIYDRYDDLLAW